MISSNSSPSFQEDRKRFRLPDALTVLDACVKLVPAAALLSALFVLDGDLRWIGLLGVVPLFFAFQRDCPGCRLHRCRRADSWPSWPGH